MSMHIESPALTTTSYKKRKEKITKAKQAQLESDWRDRNQRLKGMGLPKETFDQFIDWVYGRGKKEKEKTNSRYPATKTISSLSAENSVRCETNKTNTSSNTKEWITGAVSSPPPKIYTGSKVKGIAQTHKSNAIPIFDIDHIEDIAHMRR